MSMQSRTSSNKLKNGGSKSASNATKPTLKSSKSPGIRAKPTAPLDSNGGNDTEPIDYSEEYDLPEPTEEEIERDIAEALKEEIQGEHLPSVDLTLDVIVARHLMDEEPLPHGPSQARERFLAGLSYLRLDRRRICTAPSHVLVMLPNITHLYLQHNRLTSMEGVASLPSLKFLAASHNQIEAVDGVSGLSELMFLDVSHNLIAKLDARGELPTSLCFLKVGGNPVLHDEDADKVEADLLVALPQLKDLDGAVTLSRKNRARQILGFDPLEGLGPEEEEGEEEEEEDYEEEEEGGVQSEDIMGEGLLKDSNLSTLSGQAMAAGVRTTAQQAAGPSAAFSMVTGSDVGSMMDLLDAVERSCLGKSEASVLRSSVKASVNKLRNSLRDSMSLRLRRDMNSLASTDINGTAPSSSMLDMLPGNSPTTSRPSSSTSSSRGLNLLPAVIKPLPSMLQRTSSSGNKRLLLEAAAGLNLNSPLKPTASPAGSASNSHSRPSSSTAAGSGTLPLSSSSSGLLPAQLSADTLRAPHLPTAASSTSRPASAALSSISRLEALIAADLNMLQGKLDMMLRASANPEADLKQDSSKSMPAKRPASGKTSSASRPGSASSTNKYANAFQSGSSNRDPALMNRMMADAAERIREQRSAEAVVSENIRQLRQSGGALRQLHQRAAGTLSSGVSVNDRRAAVTAGSKGDTVLTAEFRNSVISHADGHNTSRGGGDVVPELRRSAAAFALLRASSGNTASESPLESLKAMADRVEGLGKGLIDLAEGRRPPSATSSAGRSIAASGNGTSRQGSGSSGSKSAAVGGELLLRPSLRLVDVREEEEEAEQVEQLPDYDYDNNNSSKRCERSDDQPSDDGGGGSLREDEDDLDLSGLGFKTSLPPNPF